MSELPDLDRLEGGFLFGCGTGYPRGVFATPDGREAYCVVALNDAVSPSPQVENFGDRADRAVTDEELQRFLDVYGFKPAEKEKPTISPWGIWASTANPEQEFPSAEYVHIDAIRSVMRLGQGDSIETENIIRMIEAFEALRRAEA